MSTVVGARLLFVKGQNVLILNLRERERERLQNDRRTVRHRVFGLNPFTIFSELYIVGKLFLLFISLKLRSCQKVLDSVLMKL